jgi:hypothetical protein
MKRSIRAQYSSRKIARLSQPRLLLVMRQANWLQFLMSNHSIAVHARNTSGFYRRYLRVILPNVSLQLTAQSATALRQQLSLGVMRSLVANQ